MNKHEFPSRMLIKDRMAIRVTRVRLLSFSPGDVLFLRVGIRVDDPVSTTIMIISVFSFILMFFFPIISNSWDIHLLFGPHGNGEHVTFK